MKGNNLEKMWPTWINAKHILAIALIMAVTQCFAEEFGAITDGNLDGGQGVGFRVTRHIVGRGRNLPPS